MVLLVIAGLILVVVFTAAGVEIARQARRPGRHRDRQQLIRSYAFPPGLRAKVAAELPSLSEAQLDRVHDGLRDWFLVCLETRYRRTGVAGMPSRAVDVAWHEFILFTREYADFCQRAFGGYLHHAPESVMTTPMHQALARTLSTARALAPAAAVPALFTLDAELGLDDGYRYDDDALAHLALRPARAAATPAATTGGGCGGGAGCAGGGGSGSGSGGGDGGGGCGGGGCGGCGGGG